MGALLERTSERSALWAPREGASGVPRRAGNRTRVKGARIHQPVGDRRTSRAAPASPCCTPGPLAFLGAQIAASPGALHCKSPPLATLVTPSTDSRWQRHSVGRALRAIAVHVWPKHAIGGFLEKSTPSVEISRKTASGRTNAGPPRRDSRHALPQICGSGAESWPASARGPSRRLATQRALGSSYSLMTCSGPAGSGSARLRHSESAEPKR